MTRQIAALIALPALLLSPAVHAQQSATPAAAATEAPPSDPLSQGPDGPAAPTVFDSDYLTIGVGAAYGPGYEGSNSYVVFPVVGLQGRIAGFTISPRPAGLAVDLIKDPDDSKIAFNLGPVVRTRLDRTQQIRDPAVLALGKRDVAVETGVTAGFTVSRITNPYDSLSFGTDVRWDIAGAHKGTVIQPSMSYLTPLSKAIAVAVTLSAEHVDDKYAHYYYDVTAAGSAASGMRPYRAHAGWKGASLSLVSFYDLDGNLADGGFALVGGLSYARLLGNFAQSPIVSQRGSKDQFLIGGGVAYTF
ncbi:MipA/OmpV family protein [Sphingobium nicotianae]|uniref:MipA/OmpV family protein n=1 Tax=Sphingobium nicotianae TaxID=2782607 RepID=A0A9X1IQ99_9SPHN|nr:MipA/OmpV family protein [Sphingobium nicotianae]MBT2186582.1 MipA/OmpV family protein [Sphingobium nicotianae]